MTKLLEQAIEQARARPDDEQDIAAEMLLSLLSKQSEPVPLDAETRVAVEEGLAQALRGEFASDEEIAARWKRHGL